MASEDVVGKSRGDTAVNTIVNLAEEAELAREGVKGPGHQVLTVCKSLHAGGIAGGLIFRIEEADDMAPSSSSALTSSSPMPSSTTSPQGSI